MKINVTISLFFEIKEAEIFNYDIGYCETKIDLYTEEFANIDIQKYSKEQINSIAKTFNVPIENVKIISRIEYEENTEE